jgi:hypothetical protein
MRVLSRSHFGVAVSNFRDAGAVVIYFDAQPKLPRRMQ